ncbi:SDR family oxidoreductase [Pseudonocardia sp. H11422]|uniref:SDR family oxidoreductase n=1 Tax=Pseudonocardia sp. H11422 TaxID=2835866 RepID=UPI001BDCD87A|nr:SDR family oxidoreductase [Pseudonocardia sp. H11422]
MKLLDGRVVLVSGGTQGIGAGVSRTAAREGAAVVLTGRRPAPGEALAAQLLELFDAHVAVNLRGPFFLMQAVVADMVGRGAPGSIVNVISSSELGGQRYLAPYVAAKAGLAGLTRNAAHAHRFDRIRINGLDIGWTDTEGEELVQRTFHGAGDDWREQAGRSLPMGRLGRVDEIAEFVVFLLSDRSGVVTGSVLDWDQNVLGGLG